MAGCAWYWGLGSGSVGVLIGVYFVASCYVGISQCTVQKTYEVLVNRTEQQTIDQCNMIRALMDTCVSDRNCMSAVKEPCPRRQSPSLVRDLTATPVAPWVLTLYTVCSYFAGFSPSVSTSLEMLLKTWHSWLVFESVRFEPFQGRGMY